MPEDNAKTFLVLANTYYKSGDIKKAIEYYHKSIAEDPSYDKAFYNLGVAYNKMGLEEKAIECFKSAASLGHEQSIEIVHQIGIEV